eukprot:350077-Chlamydomonas_euryale.AAC.15
MGELVSASSSPQQRSCANSHAARLKMNWCYGYQCDHHAGLHDAGLGLLHFACHFIGSRDAKTLAHDAHQPSLQSAHACCSKACTIWPTLQH